MSQVRAYCKAAGVAPRKIAKLTKAEKRQRDLTRARDQRTTKPQPVADRWAKRIEAGTWKRHPALDAQYRDARGRQMMRADGLYSGEGCLIVSWETDEAEAAE